MKKIVFLLVGVFGLSLNSTAVERSPRSSKAYCSVSVNSNSLVGVKKVLWEAFLRTVTKFTKIDSNKLKDKIKKMKDSEQNERGELLSGEDLEEELEKLTKKERELSEKNNIKIGIFLNILNKNQIPAINFKTWNSRAFERENGQKLFFDITLCYPDSKFMFKGEQCTSSLNEKDRFDSLLKEKEFSIRKLHTSSHHQKLLNQTLFKDMDLVDRVSYGDFMVVSFNTPCLKSNYGDDKPCESAKLHLSLVYDDTDLDETSAEIKERRTDFFRNIEREIKNVEIKLDKVICKKA